VPLDLISIFKVPDFDHSLLTGSLRLAFISFVCVSLI
jgi:hypothetical protein